MFYLRQKIIKVAVVAAVGAVVWLLWQPHHGAIGITWNSLEMFTVSEPQVPVYSDFDKQIYTFTNADTRVRVERYNALSAENFSRLTDNQLILFKSLYEQKLPPYPEFLTNQTGCSEDLKPILLPEHENSFLTYAGERENFGLCDPASVVYRASVTYHYCPEANAGYVIRVFSTPSTTKEVHTDLIGSLTCQ